MDRSTAPENHRAAADPPAGIEDPPGPANRSGLGTWVESSWELRRGLTVHEGAPADADLAEGPDATGSG